MIINFQYSKLPDYQRNKTVNDVNHLIMIISILFFDVKRFSKKNLNKINFRSNWNRANRSPIMRNNTWF